MKINRIKNLRIDNDLTQQQIASVLNCSQRAYSHYESGEREIPLVTLIALADYYNVSLDYLVGRQFPKKINDKKAIK